MAIRRILVPFAATEPAGKALDAAFALARALDAHVAVLHVRPDPQATVPLLGEGVSGAMVEELITLTEREAASHARQARSRFDARRAEAGLDIVESPTAHGPSVRWLEVTGREDDATVREGRLADLIVIGHAEGDGDPFTRATLDAALFESGRPVLIAAGRPAAAAGDRVAIAWNGSAEAARAVTAALPLLHRAADVRIYVVDAEVTRSDAGSGLVDFLAWHGITAEAGGLPSGQGAVGETLLAAAAADRIDLLVLGAYTHSRLRQLILGGVTRHLIEHARLPLLMAH
ncbi:MAG: universal stress protein [Rhodospirillales bacterium]|nr:MAG: universal stress protein [Rhodospirillales bacterium]